MYISDFPCRIRIFQRQIGSYMIKLGFITKILSKIQNFQVRAMKPSSRPVVKGFFCIIWTSLGPYRIDLDPCYEKIHFL